MNLVEDKLPEIGQLVIAYKDGNAYYFAKYGKVLTWKGYKLKFVNLMSNGLWHDDVVGWNRIPTREENLI